MSEREHHPEHSGQAITIQRVDPILDTGVVVTCPVLPADDRLPDRYTGYLDNISPPLEWTQVPDALAWASGVEDPDAPQETPFVHWMIWNLPAGMARLPEGVANEPRLVSPPGAVQGRNGM